MAFLNFFRQLARQPRRAILPLSRDLVASLRSGTTLTKAGRRMRPSSVGSFHDALNHLGSYEQHMRQPFFIDQMSDQWFRSYQTYLLTLKLRHNSVASTLNKTKILLRRICREQKVPYLVDEFHVSEEITTKIFNTMSEIKDMATINLSDSAELAMARDIYVIQCMTGLRYSSLKAVLANPRAYVREVQERHYLDLMTLKALVEVVIPLAPMALTIFERRNWSFAPTTVQAYNRNVKKIGKRTGLTQAIVETYTTQGVVTQRHQPKWLMMSSHTARRSFATNAFLAGISAQKIMKITGHKTETSFMLYIRADAMASAQTLIEHSFFAQ